MGNLPRCQSIRNKGALYCALECPPPRLATHFNYLGQTLSDANEDMWTMLVWPDGMPVCILASRLLSLLLPSLGCD
jgi:hypothetical protein